MASAGTILTWADPATPATTKPTASTQIHGPGDVLPTRAPLGSITRPVTEEHFYGTIKFGSPVAFKNAQKIDIILETIREQNWTLAGFLYNIFRSKDAKGCDIHRSQTHSQMVSIFLAGRAKETTIGKKVGDEAETAVKLDSGLHVSIGTKHPETKLRREDFGEGTIPRVQSVIERDQRVTLYLFNKIAVRKPRKQDGVVVERKTRPAATVITHAIASLNFCRTDQANLLPLMRGILYLGSSAPVELINYNCRIGNMPAPDTIRRALITLSKDEARATTAHGEDPDTAGFLFVDNTQNYHRQRDLRIGRKNVMNVGMSGLYMEAPDVDSRVFNLEDKRKLIAENRRKDVTVDDLIGFLDQEDTDSTGTLLVLDVLAGCIPSLKPISKEISLPIVHPLACSGKKQTIPTELKDAMLDFLQQIGQTPESFLKRKLPVGGDGLTYAMLLQLQSFLQYHDDAFKSFEIMEPQLQVWHTKWTDVIRIFQTHWGRTSGKNTNPAALGFSAAKIGRVAPSDMKKVEFYPGTQLMYLVLDAKLLDIWRLAFKTDDIFKYFEGLAETRNLPDFETLLPIARKLYRAYGTARGRDHAMYETGTTGEWAQTIPMGSAWIPQEIEDSSLEKKRKSKGKAFNPSAKKKKKKKVQPTAPPCEGDFVLAQDIDFIRDSLNSRKLSTAVVRGDVGRMYECIKYLLFTFGGSTHTNYLNYVLETIVSLELESTPGLKVALLRGLIWNLSGLPEPCEEGDYIVEFFDRLLEDVVRHGGAQFGGLFVRGIVSRDLRHIAQLKVAWRTGVGMKKKSHKHKDPHSNPEMLTLLKLYRDTELHSRRLGRQVDDRDTDDFARGDRSQATSSPDSDSESTDKESDDSESASSQSDSDDDMAGAGNFYATRGSIFMVDGELVLDDRDMLVGPEDEDEYFEHD
ncbi:hypothetical protein B0H19DRAFT_1210268 [Mycena capillaripes]|nr:hypothetical protein B0H19DRAFT_1210268 [Mycena capillaripes]